MSIYKVLARYEYPGTLHTKYPCLTHRAKHKPAAFKPVSTRILTAPINAMPNSESCMNVAMKCTKNLAKGRSQLHARYLALSPDG
ncbi:hypothetical protein OPQ81_003135 [Rhizoctonia solani]|nr:hypothetical protein OPQ81_003135 [Rhizoctonia solani]